MACLCFGAIGAGLVIDKKDAAPIGGIVFCTLAIAGMSYAMSAYWLNRTTIDVTRDSIVGEHGPIPFPRSPSFAINRDDIDQLYVQAIREVTGDHGQVLYQVCALLHSRDRVRIFDCGYARRRTMDETKALAERIERHVETFLGIEDRPVDAPEITVVMPPSSYYS